MEDQRFVEKNREFGGCQCHAQGIRWPTYEGNFPLEDTVEKNVLEE